MDCVCVGLAIMDEEPHILSKNTSGSVNTEEQIPTKGLSSDTDKEESPDMERPAKTQANS